MALSFIRRRGMSPNLMSRLLRQIGLPGRNRCRSCHNSGFPSGPSADVSFFVLAAARYLFWAPPFGLLSLISPDDLLTGGEFPQKRKSAPGACERISKKPTTFFNIFVGNFSKNVHHRNQHTSGEFLRNFIG